MEETKLTFKRYEKKYLLSPETYAALRERLDPYIEPDEYPSSTVCSLYYDSDDYRLIRHSIEGPVYKEKLRLRSYGVPGDGDTVFIELKKKYKGIVYKRRVAMPAAAAEAWLAGERAPGEDSQMIREIAFFLDSCRPAAKVYLACDRTAWRAKDDPELRITFDQNIRWRRTELDLRAGSGGEPLLENGQVLMELKLPEAAPLWLAHLLSEFSLFPTSFSKYGTCYKEHILEDYVKGVIFSA
ncbi:MAG: polyphosphate polymerase domain-containing protein [Oscillospiraceae bacterium]|nr:polyphosphate polymerase domain-containing protein [Oscillospiraceae bacterium]